MAPAPYTTSKPVPKKVVNPLIEKRPRNFGIGKIIALIIFFKNNIQNDIIKFYLVVV